MLKRWFVFAFALFIGSSCGQRGSTEQSANTQSAGMVSDTFAKKTYYTHGRQRSIRIMSSNEIELSTGGDNLIGSYTRDGDKLRVVLEMLGTKQSQYYAETREGLRAERDGTMFYNETALAEIERREAKEREEEQARQVALAAEQEKARLAAAEAEARCRVLFDNAQVSTDFIGVFKGYYEPVTLRETEIVNGNNRRWFGIIGESQIKEIDSRPYHPASKRVYEVGFIDYWEPQRWIRKPVLASETESVPNCCGFRIVFETRSEAERFTEASNKARLAWREKWQELLSCR